MIITGGLLVATTWDRLDTLSLMKDIMELVLGFPPPPPEMNPMALSQEGLFHQMVKASQLFCKVDKAECIYHDQIDDQMLRRPDGRPDASWVTRWLLGDQMAPGDQNGDLICIELLPFGQISGPLKKCASFI